jgi:hypothetical protein
MIAGVIELRSNTTGRCLSLCAALLFFRCLRCLDLMGLLDFVLRDG